jgi:hypothetical protein
MLQFVDPNVLLGDQETRFTPLHDLAYLADPFDYSTHETDSSKTAYQPWSQCQRCNEPTGRNTVAKGMPGNVTNLDFLKLLLKRCNPNSQDYLGQTPLMFSIPLAPDA